MSDIPGQCCQIRAKILPKIHGTEQDNEDISINAEFWTGLLPMAVFETSVVNFGSLLVF